MKARSDPVPVLCSAPLDGVPEKVVHRVETEPTVTPGMESHRAEGLGEGTKGGGTVCTSLK